MITCLSHLFEVSRMKPITTRTNLILVGHWNRLIFTPEWVTENLFRPEEIYVAVLPIDPIKYVGTDFTLEVSFPKLAFVPVTVDKDKLLSTEERAISILNRLPDTPLKAFGVNFGFDATRKELRDQSLFEGSDLAKMPSKPTKCSVTRQIPWKDWILNLSLTLTQESIAIDLNFHSDQALAKNAAISLKGRVSDFFDNSIKLIREVYGPELT